MNLLRLIFLHFLKNLLIKTRRSPKRLYFRDVFKPFFINPMSPLVFMLVFGIGAPAFSQQIGGDFRYRHEYIDAEGKELRNRQRIRARLNMTAKINDEVNLGFQLGSGTEDPVSTNQTLDGGFSAKQVNIDMAFFEWKPGMLSGVSVSGGKVRNPFYSPAKTQLLWDNDLTPEGIAFKYSKSEDSSNMFLNASYFWVDERTEQNDAVLLGGQTGIDYTTSVGKLVFGIGYFDYQNTKNYVPFFSGNDSAGNSVDSNGMYVFDYNDIEFFCEIFPNGLIDNMYVFVDYVNNIAEDVKYNQSWLAGFSYGNAKEPGSFDIRYSYRYIEKDAIIGAFTDSDFIGGGSDGKGHEINFNYQVASKTKVTATCFINQKGIDNGKGYNRVHLDFNFTL